MEEIIEQGRNNLLLEKRESGEDLEYAKLSYRLGEDIMAEVIKISKQHGRPEVGKLYQNSLDSGDFTYFNALYDYIIEANYHYLSADNIYSEV